MTGFEGILLIIENNNFILEHIAASGQCFRMNKTEKEKYNLVAGDRFVTLEQLDERRVRISCGEEEFLSYWQDYFDLEYDYKSIVSSLLAGEDEFLRKAAAYGWGLRILRQELFEILITFIISQRKSIPAIKRCVEELCLRFGERKQDSATGMVYYTFPLPESLAFASTEALRETGLGYRDEYVRQTSLAVVKGEIHLNSLPAADYEEAVKELMKLSGVGIKVANCVALYGLHLIDAFPVDVWIDRILKSIYDNRFDAGKYKGYAGIIQQYMFYYIRSL